MLYLNTESDVKPERVTMELLPGGAKTIRMADNVREFHQEETPGRTMYRFDEVVFTLPDGAPQEVADIEADFATWWDFGKEDHNTQPDPDVQDPLPGSGVMSMKEMTEALKAMQEQNAMLEECILEMSGVVYA